MNREFRIHMKAVGEEFDGTMESCPSETELIDYQAGRLTTAEGEAVQTHLMRCEACRVTLLDAAAFFEPPRSGESTPNIRGQWRALNQRLGKENRRHRVLFSPRMAWALAPILFVVPALTAVLALKMWRDLAEQKTVLEERIARAEKEHQTQIAELRKPQLNTRVLDVFAQVERSGPRALTPPQAIAVGERETFTLILNGAGHAVFPQYRIEILNERGEPVWRADGLLRDTYGNYLISIPGSFLKEGQYTFRITGLAPQRDRKVADYIVFLKRPSK